MYFLKSRRVLGLLLVLLIAFPAASVSATSAGQSCKKVGALATSKIAGKTTKLVCKKVGKKLMWVAKGAKTTSACASSGVCVIGDIGPGGGIVFYDAGSLQSWGRYLEAAPKTWHGGTRDPEAFWSCTGTSVSGGLGTAIGTGATNTASIVAEETFVTEEAVVHGCSKDGVAAVIADLLTLGGKSDWFLPSRDELNMIYFNLVRKCAGFVGCGVYWSSSEANAGDAWFQSFNSGDRRIAGKLGSLYVWPVRAFG